MPRLVYGNPANWKQQYVTSFYGDPNVPAGYILEGGSDGAVDRIVYPDQSNLGIKQYEGGVNSGGFPAYTNDATQRSDWPNGIRKDGNTSIP